MIFYLTIALMLGCAIITVVTFFLYVRARMAERHEYHEPGSGPDLPDAHRQERHRLLNAGLDRKEQRYRSIHFISLFIFVVLGVLLLIIVSNRQTL
jgi:hypothetical protein